MEQNQRAPPPRSYQLHPARPVVTELFNLYLGRTTKQRHEEGSREPPNKAQKRVLALDRDLPPPNEQFLSDFEELQRQFTDQEQLRLVTEYVSISLIIQCSSHASRAEFLLFALKSLSGVGCINWDTFLPTLLSSVSSAEVSLSQGSQAVGAVSSNSMQQTGIVSSANLSGPSNFQPSNPTSPLASLPGVGSPTYSASEPQSSLNMSPLKSNEATANQNNQFTSSWKGVSSTRDNAITCLRQLCCKIILSGLESNLKPGTYAEVFNHMMTWLVHWDQRQPIPDSDGAKFWRPNKAMIEWLHSCLDVVWLLVGEDKCRVPFYELLRSGLQFIENIPDDEALFALILEIHRRRDMMAMHMQMLDQHLHCPSFGTHRFLSHGISNFGGEAVTNMRYPPITYPSVLGEPLHGEDLADCILKGTLDWERALRCIRHALRTAPSPDWWKRVLLVAPCYRQLSSLSTLGAVFTSEMICEATIDRIIELLKLSNSGKSFFLLSSLIFMVPSVREKKWRIDNQIISVAQCCSFGVLK